MPFGSFLPCEAHPDVQKPGSYEPGFCQWATRKVLDANYAPAAAVARLAYLLAQRPR